MRILLLGGDGQIGWELRRSLAPLGEVIALGRSLAPLGEAIALGQRADSHGAIGSSAETPNAERSAEESSAEKPGLDEADVPIVDFEKPNLLRQAVRRVRPDLIVNAAAYTDVDRAESEPDRAARVNAEAPAMLAAEAKRLDAWLVHYSTDYVFDGSGARPWSEDDTTAPINMYGQTKWEGEEAVRRAGCRHVILRTQWIYSARRRNFLRTVLAAAAERAALEIVDDQTGAPTGADLVADVTAHVLRTIHADGASGTYDAASGTYHAPAGGKMTASGTFHVAARGETTWCGFARFAIEHARRAGWPMALGENGIVPIPSAARPAGARRPCNGRLSIDRLERSFGLRMPDWRPGVLRVLAELGPESVREPRSARAPLERIEPAT